MPKHLPTEMTSAPELATTSESEQMYLITVARAVEAGAEGPVSISKIADALGVSLPAANEMVRKLDGRGLLGYEPYHGVLLSDAGHRIAGQVLRTRRLWATFLVEHLGFSPTAADDQACHLEHSTTEEASDRLATFLGNPAAGPLGRRIPDTTARVPRDPDIRLTDLPVGQAAEVISVTAATSALDFFSAEGINIGVGVTIAASGTSGLLVALDEGEVHLSKRLASTIGVRPNGGARAPA